MGSRKWEVGNGKFYPNERSEDGRKWEACRNQYQSGAKVETRIESTYASRVTYPITLIELPQWFRFTTLES